MEDMIFYDFTELDLVNMFVTDWKMMEMSERTLQGTYIAMRRVTRMRKRWRKLRRKNVSN